MAEFSRPSVQTIAARIRADMEARITSKVRIPRFSLLGVLAFVFAGAMHLLYGYLSKLVDQNFIDTASTTFLDRIANLYGLPRKAATYAEGQVFFTGVDATVIPAGTQVRNSEGFIYSTLDEATITGGGVSAEIQANEPGIASNTEETTLQLVAADPNIDTEVSATIPPNGGTEQETDEQLRARLKQRLQNPPSSGTDADYVRWALEVEGVGKAWTLSAENYKGAGTVASVIATAALEVVDSQVKQDVIDNIETQRPVGAQVDVVDLIPLPTKYIMRISPNNSQLRQNISTNLDNLHLAETVPGGTLLLSHIRSAIASSGVIDYVIDDIELNGNSIGVQNIETSGFDTAVFDSTDITDLV